MEKILIIGAGSYLAENIEEFIFPMYVKKISHNYVLDSQFLTKFDTIINFSIQPEFSEKLLKINDLIDVQLAKNIQGANTKLVMLSSRKVYGLHKKLDIIKETDRLSPFDFYSMNKLRAENELKKILPMRHLILRTGNILGNPSPKKGYKTFMGWISDSIREKGYLLATEHPTTRKDFISKEYFQYALSQLIKQDVLGTLNIGAGFSIPLKDLLESILGYKNIVFDNNLQKPSDQFILNIEKLAKHVKRFSHKELMEQCKKTKQLILNIMDTHVSG